MAEVEETEKELEEAEKEAKEKTEAPEKAKEKAEQKGLSEEEVNKRIEAARKQEKDKLYSVIDELKSKVSEMSDAAKQELQDKARIEQEAKDKVEKERLAQLSADERMAEQLNKIEEQLAEERTARERLEKAAEQDRKSRSLEEYKQKLLRDAGEEIIPELVTGNSEQEIEKNTAIAKARYKEIFDATFAKAQGDQKQGSRRTDPDPEPMEEAELQKSAADLDVDMRRYHRDPVYKAEIEKKRDAIRERISLAYQRQAGR